MTANLAELRDVIAEQIQALRWQVREQQQIINLASNRGPTSPERAAQEAVQNAAVCLLGRSIQQMLQRQISELEHQVKQLQSMVN